MKALFYQKENLGKMLLYLKYFRFTKNVSLLNSAVISKSNNERHWSSRLQTDGYASDYKR